MSWGEGQGQQTSCPGGFEMERATKVAYGQGGGLVGGPRGKSAHGAVAYAKPTLTYPSCLAIL